jgi:hypothetical protein
MRDSDPLPEPILLPSSGDVQVGTKECLLYSIRRPPCERVERNAGRLDTITATHIDLEKVIAMDPEYMAPAMILQDVSVFRKYLKNGDPVGKKLSRFMLRHLTVQGRPGNKDEAKARDDVVHYEEEKWESEAHTRLSTAELGFREAPEHVPTENTRRHH